jgi:hypothetical protein
VRRLSGWARLWIVASVLIWAGGGWWLHENPLPGPYNLEGPNPRACVSPDLQGGDLFPRACESNRLQRVGDTFISLPTCDELEEMQRQCETQMVADYRADKAGIDARNAARIQRHELMAWGRFGLLAISPFGVAVVFLLLRALAFWIMRGFKTN